MITYLDQRRKTLPYRILSAFVAITFVFSMILPTPGFAQTILNLPVPGTMVPMSTGFAPAIINRFARPQRGMWNAH